MGIAMGEITMNLTPTQYLIVEVLTARARLGERWWQFPLAVRKAAEELAAMKFVNVESGVIQNSFRVSFTDAGRQEFVTSPAVYLSPVEKSLRTCVGILDQALAPAMWSERFTMPATRLGAPVDVAKGVVEVARLEQWTTEFNTVLAQNPRVAP